MDLHLIKVLIIDDSPEDQELYIRFLKKLYFNIQINTSQLAKEGITQLENEDFDLVFLDYVLPDMDGLEFLKLIKEKELLYCPVIIFTGQGDEEIAANFIKLGATDYIVKNKIQLDSLHRISSNALEKYKYEKLLIEKQTELNNFAHTLAHDLRAPIGRLLTYSSLLKRKLDENVLNISTVIKYADNIQHDAIYCLNFISALVSYTETGRSTQTLVNIDLNEVVKQSIQNLENDIRNKSAIIKVLPLPTVMGDRIALVQLFQNLIANALKYNLNIPKVEIFSEKVDKETKIFVKDNGIGIPSEKSQEIFKPFVKLDNNSQEEGFGLGLALCKIITKQHSASINVESTLGIGTTFNIIFPSYIQ